MIETHLKVNIENFSNGDKYIGEFKDGRMVGNGTYYHSNGEKYEG